MSSEIEKSVNLLSLETSETLENANDSAYKMFVDEFFVNGFNKVKAAMTVNPEQNYKAANVWANRVMKKPNVMEYIKAKNTALRASTHIDNVRILNELLSYAYSDITEFIGLSPEDIKSLPPQVRRTIQSYDTETTIYYDKELKTNVSQTKVKLKLKDSLKAIDMISRHIDFFNADNQSKQGAFDLTQATNEEMNVILSMMQRIKKQKEIQG
jgi:phage terminase small subunit